jgi:cytochrome c553
VRIVFGSPILLLISLVVQTASAQDEKSVAAERGTISFQTDVFPVIKKKCLPCHAEDNYNPSELSLDSHALLMEGGKHGVAAVPGKAAESLLVQKLGEKPPFGDRMPLDPKKKKGELSTKKLSDEEIRLISDWVAQGAKNN